MVFIGASGGDPTEGKRPPSVLPWGGPHEMGPLLGRLSRVLVEALPQLVLGIQLVSEEEGGAKSWHAPANGAVTHKRTKTVFPRGFLMVLWGQGLASEPSWGHIGASWGHF